MNKSKNKYYVYVYLDPRKPGNYIYGDYKFEYEPFYIGKGSGTRWRDHLVSDFVNKEKTLRIKNIEKDTSNKPIIIKYKKNITEDEAFKIEIDMISVIGRNVLNKGPLLNIQGGGRNFKNWIITENWLKNNKIGLHKRWSKKENREKQSRKLKEIWNRPFFKDFARKIMLKRWKNNREEMVSYQQREDVKKKKSISSIECHSLKWILISGEGERFVTNRLKDFCRDKKLNVEMLQQVAMAKKLNYKGWLCFKYGTEEETKEKLILLKQEKEKREIERREKLRIASTGRKKSEEEKRKIGEAAKGNKYGFGYKHSKESIEKIRQASLKMWAERRDKWTE